MVASLLLLQQNVAFCGCAPARWDVMYLSHYLEKREYTNSYFCGGSVYWRYCLCGWKCVCGGGCGHGIGYEWEGGGLHCKPILGYVI